MWLTILKGNIAGGIVIAVAEIGPKYPRIGGLLLTLPLVSVLAFIVMWSKQSDLPAVSKLATETLILWMMKSNTLLFDRKLA